MHMHDVDVLVVGAGPVGLATALALKHRGLQVEIIDAALRPASHSYALALHASVLDALRAYVDIDPLIDDGLQVRRVALLDQTDVQAVMHLQELDATYNYVLVTRQDVFEGYLVRALQAAGVHVQWARRLSQLTGEAAGGCVATIDALGSDSVGYAVAGQEEVIDHQRQVRARHVVGADGHESTVRSRLDVDWVACGTPQTFAVFEFRATPPDPQALRLVFDAHGLSSLWPLPSGFVRWSFEINEDDVLSADRVKERNLVQLGGVNYAQLDLGLLETHLSERAPWFKSSVSDLRWAVVVRFERRLASQFATSGVWLAGDAAHTTGPAGVQSMNVGVHEAFEIAERIRRVTDGASLAEEAAAYRAARQRTWRQLLGIDSAPQPAADAVPLVRDRAAEVVPCIPASGAHLQQLAQQIGLTMPQQVEIA